MATHRGGEGMTGTQGNLRQVTESRLECVAWT